MGALDFLKEFEGRAIDAASYKLLQRNFELQEDNIAMLKDKVTLIEQRLAEAEAEVANLRKKNEELHRITESASREVEFKIFGGIAFQRGPDGKFDVQPYCPNCYTPMSNTVPRIYNCPSCKYAKQPNKIPEYLALELNGGKLGLGKNAKPET